MSSPASSSSTSTSDINRKREHIFLDSSDLSTPNQMFLQDSTSQPSQPFIKLPFPPCIDPYKLISNRKQDSSLGLVPARTPNAFIIYRKIFIESARKEGYHLPMTVISSMASKSWKHEPDIVKDEYKRISKQAFEIRKQLLPKSERKMKKEKWNFVSFSKKSNLDDNSNKIEMKISADYQNKDQQKDLVENSNSFNTGLKTSSLHLSADESSYNNVDDENILEKLPNSNYQVYNKDSMHYSYIDNKNVEFDEINELSLSNANMNNQHQFNNNNANQTANSDSLMQNSHYYTYM